MPIPETIWFPTNGHSFGVKCGFGLPNGKIKISPACVGGRFDCLLMAFANYTIADIHCLPFLSLGILPVLQHAIDAPFVIWHIESSQLAVAAVKTPKLIGFCIPAKMVMNKISVRGSDEPGKRGIFRFKTDDQQDTDDPF